MALIMTDEARKLADIADEIEQSDGIALMLTGGPKQLGIRRTAMVVAALRSQPGTLAREEVARIIDPIAFTALERSYIVPAPEEFTRMKIAREKADVILALAPSHEAGTQEPVAWTNKAQLGFLKDPSCFGIPMAMWGEPHERAHSVPLYAAPQPASVAHDATRDEILRGLATFFEESEHLVWSNGEIADCLAMMVYDGPSVPSTDRGGQ